MAENNYSSVAVDLRGHGDSISKNGREISWRTFSRKEFQKMPMDIETVYQYLVKKEKVDPNSIFIMGASIGANAALLFAAREPELGGILLLSPGLDYRGLESIPSAQEYGDRPVFYSASAEDLSSAEAARHLARISKQATLIDLAMAGHGTQMIENSDFLMNSILSWLDERP